MYPTSTNDPNRAEAMALLAWAATHTRHRHGDGNRYLAWLRTRRSITREEALAFLNAWFPVSRHQPQLLLLCAASFHDWIDRAWIMRNYVEEDGHAQAGHEPHYAHLIRTIRKMGGVLDVNPATENLARDFRESVGRMHEDEAAGLIAGIEAPALDISEMLHLVIGRSGFARLLETDFYLTIHVGVEPIHIQDSFRAAKIRFESGLTGREEVLRGFNKALDFWEAFWPVAFETLGYRGGRTSPVFKAA